MLCFEDRESMLCRRVTEHFTSDWDTNMEFPVTDRIPSALLVLTHRDRTDTIYLNKYNRDMGVATGITSMKTEFMTI